MPDQVSSPPPATSNPKDQNSGDSVAESKAEAASAEPGSLVKHPLQNKWALWYFKNDRSKNWDDNLKIVAKFQFVEDFWALYNHIQPASRLQTGCDYSLFKDGIRPAWEDQRNKLGGRWLLTLNKQQRSEELDAFWLETLLCLIGEAFEEYGDDICGATINVRGKADKLAIWTADVENKEAVMAIGRKLKARLGVPAKTIIGYEPHDEAMARKSSMAKTKYSV